MADMTLEKARELLDGTTPGPWRVPYTFFMPMDMKVASDLARAYIAQAARAEAADAEVARLREVVRYYGEGTGDMGEYARAAIRAHQEAEE